MSTSIGQFRHSHYQSTYTENFVVEGKRLTSQTGKNTYGPDQIEIVRYFRLKKDDKPGENQIVYLIEIFDGSLGFLVYGFDVFTDCKVYSFLREYVEYKSREERGEVATAHGKNSKKLSSTLSE